MKILALDTAGKTASCALCNGGSVAALEQRDSMLDHSRTLLVLCRDMLEQQGIAMDDIDVFACTVGPGSFTGIRIGVAAVKGFGWTGGRPCAGISTLLAMVYQADRDGVFCCRIAARENEYYYGFFERKKGQINRLTEDAIAPWPEIEARMSQWPGCTVLTDGHNAAGVALAAWELAAEGRLVSCHQLAPVYLRRPQAERLRLEQLEADGKDSPRKD